MNIVKPLSGLTKTVNVMLCIYMFVMACLVMTSIFELIEYAPYESTYQLEDLLLSQYITGLTALLFLLVYLITGIFFLKWVYRTSKNMHMLGGDRWEHSAGSAVWWYFVPVASLFKPYQAMREIWSKAHKKKWGGETKLLPGWWTLWLISIILGQTVSRLPTATIRECQVNSSLTIVANLLNIALGFAALALISNIGRAYEEHYCKEQSDDAKTPEILQEPPRPSDVQANLQGLEEK